MDGIEMKKHVIVTLCCISSFSVFGCSKDGKLGVEGSPAWHNRVSAAEKAAYFGKACSSYGFKSGTPEMAQCIAQETRQSVQAGREAVANAIRNATKPRPQPQRLRTTCTKSFNTIYCS